MFHSFGISLFPGVVGACGVRCLYGDHGYEVSHLCGLQDS